MHAIPHKRGARKENMSNAYCTQQESQHVPRVELTNRLEGKLCAGMTQQLLNMTKARSAVNTMGEKYIARKPQIRDMHRKRDIHTAQDTEIQITRRENERERTRCNRAPLQSRTRPGSLSLHDIESCSLSVSQLLC
jgi:hypothetical protein